MKKFFLHLGLHKTGTTHLQRIFLENRAALKSSGVTWLPTADFRKKFSAAWHGRAKVKSADGETLEALLSSPDSLLVSDENILGNLYKFKRGCPYPDAAKRLKVLKKKVQGAELEVFLSFRNYGDWIESVYLQALKTQSHVCSFEDFIKRVDFDKISWSDLLQQISGVFPKAKFHLWSYEFFYKNNSKILSVFEDATSVKMPLVSEGHANPSYSGIAQKLLVAAKEGEMKNEHWTGLYKFIRANLSTRNGYSKPTLLSPEAKEALTQRYLAEMSSLAAKNPAMLVHGV